MSTPAPRQARRPSKPTPRRGAATTAVGTAAALVSALVSVLLGGTAQAATSAVLTYTVKAGDTLSGIAAREHVPGGWSALAKRNHIGSPYVIRPGEKLVLPAGSYAAKPPASPFPVAVALGRATQVITVKASGTTATVTAWQKSGTKWAAKYTTKAARIGAKGLVNGATRKQGTYTTPTGSYTVTQGFGLGADPGTRMPYHRVTSVDWWVEDPTSAYYNQMRTSVQGGFHLTEAGDDGSEHLVNHPVQYHNVLVINYNTKPVVKGRGAGIFLHDLGTTSAPTAGCVALPASVMTQIMKWIDPAQHPVIAIG
ncbi:LysM peptidoglycan-binding domain-containing protein [Streptacidiphilus sp. N1-3]|uniref:LysM peptidoglycan-binding domain-containing protein n=1 Tax=Streptacidiphilus alkalitolerans TaxID=3342712 RepID=A0ABV6X886_9ACTN